MAKLEGILSTKLGSTGFYGLRIEAESHAVYENTHSYLPYGKFMNEDLLTCEIESGTVFSGIEGIVHYKKSDNDAISQDPLAPKNVVIAFNHSKMKGARTFIAWAGNEDPPMAIDEKGLEKMLEIAPGIAKQKDSIINCGNAYWTQIDTKDDIMIIRLWLGDIPSYVSERFTSPSTFPVINHVYRPISYPLNHEDQGKFIPLRLDYLRSELQTTIEHLKLEPKHRDFILLRFLLANDESLPVAEDALKTYFKWYGEFDLGNKRKKLLEKGMDGIVKWDIVGKEWYGSFFDVQDKETNTLFILDAPEFTALAEDKITQEEMIDFWLTYLEFRIINMEKASYACGRLCFTTWIIRLSHHEQIGLSVLNKFRILVSESSPLYVHHTRTLVLLDAPSSFQTVANTICTWLPETSARKLIVAGEDENLADVLDKCTDLVEVRDQLMAQYKKLTPVTSSE